MLTKEKDIAHKKQGDHTRSADIDFAGLELKEVKDLFSANNLTGKPSMDYFKRLLVNFSKIDQVSKEDQLYLQTRWSTLKPCIPQL